MQYTDVKSSSSRKVGADLEEGVEREEESKRSQKRFSGSTAASDTPLVDQQSAMRMGGAVHSFDAHKGCDRRHPLTATP